MLSSALSQPQKEALVDLLIAAMFGDDHLSVAEDSALHEALTDLEWGSSTEIGIYMAETTAAIREERTKDPGLKAFLETRAGLFDNDDARKCAWETTRTILDADGESDVERGFLANLRTALTE